MNTTYFLNVIAGNVYHTKTSPALPTTYYLALSTTNPATAVTEPSGGGYARIQLTGMSAPTNGVVTNSAELRSPRSTAAWGTITHYAIYDAATGGNLLMHDALTKSRTIDVDMVVIFEAGELSLKVQNP